MAEVSAAAEATAAEPFRRRYLLDRTFQLKYALVMALAGLVVAGVFGLWVHQAHAQAAALLTPDPETRALLDRSDRMLLGVLAGIAALLSAALGLLGIVITHRVAGPVFVMGHYLRVISEGRFPRMRTLRNSDELRTFFKTFLDAVEALKRRERRHAEVLEDSVHRMRAAVTRWPDLAPAIEALEAAARERRLALAADSPELTPIAVPAPKKP
jgi:phage shock protein PspC (stress-responsive transcriptional regulator)